MISRLAIFTIVLACAFTGFADPGSHNEIDSSSARFAIESSKLTSPQLEARKRILRDYQQRGYVEVLSHVLDNDGLSALLAYVRVKSRIAYSIPHNQLYVYVPVVQPQRRESNLPGFTGAPSPPMAIPLRDDWSYPPDPWKAK